MEGSTQLEKMQKVAEKFAHRWSKDRHPIYSGKFWIYEERRLVPYNQWINFYERLDNENKKQG